MNHNKRHSHGRYWLGILFIVLGAIFIIDNLELLNLDLSDILRWQVILIIIGLIMILKSRDKLTGIILLFIGSLFLFTDIFDLSTSNLFEDYWPILLILFGLYILYKQKGSKSSNFVKSGWHSNRTEAKLINDQIDTFSIFGSQKKKLNTDNFKGGKITSILGGTEIDLSECKLATGPQVLDILTIFGGTEIYVPRDWQVIVNATSIFGGFDDERRRGGSEITENGTLVIKGLTLFGGGEIKN